MITLSPKIIHKAGIAPITWQPNLSSNIADNGTWANICQLSNGRLLASGGGNSSNAKYKGVWRSDDNGDTWVRCTGLNDTPYQLTVHKGIVYALGDGTYLYRSINNGDNWMPDYTASSAQDTYMRKVISPANNDARLLFIMQDANYGHRYKGKLRYVDLAVAGSVVSQNNTTVFNVIQDSPSTYWYDVKYNAVKGRYVAATSDGLYTATNAYGTWTKRYDANCSGIYITRTGRTLICLLSGGVIYTDDFVHFEQTQLTANRYEGMCTTQQGTILAVCGYSQIGSDSTQDGTGVQYSDDDGITWSTVDSSTINQKVFTGIICTATNRVIALCKNQLSGGNSIYYSDEIVIPAVYAREKYLDQNGAQEIITQFKAYCDAKVGA